MTCNLKWKNIFLLNVTGLIWDEYISQAPINNLFLQSELIIKQTKVLRLYGIDSIEKEYYRRPIINSNNLYYNSIISELDNILYDMTDRNLSIHLGKTHHFATNDKTDSTGSFHMTLMIHLSERELLFETSFINRVKWVYIFYVGIWIIFLWPIRWLRRIVFEKHLISDNMLELNQLPPNIHLNQIKNEW
ncbi:unnamed protein product [Heterobilharzia americana]|nr:unnamed protein product [Heterobilharzia americana]